MNTLSPIETIRRAVLRDGTSQDQRPQHALDGAYFQVDERALADLLAMAPDYAPHLKFHHTGTPYGDGTWSSYWEGDETIVMAQIVATDLTALDAEFTRYIVTSDDLVEHRRPGPLDQHVRAGRVDTWDRVPAYKVAQRINAWYGRLQATTQEGAFKNRIGDLIAGSLRGVFDRLGTYLVATYEVPPDRLSEQFGAVWFDREPDNRYQRTLPGTRTEMEQFLKSNFSVFREIVSTLKDIAGSRLPDTMESQLHDPGVAMYIAFAQLFAKAQEKVNAFTSHHTDYYYDKVLGLSRRPGQADCAYLVITPDTSETEVPIRKGAPFVGTVEGSPERIYEADHDLTVRPVRIDALRTLTFERDPLDAPENEFHWQSRLGDRQFATNSVIDRIEVSPKEGDRETWPLFGGPDRGVTAGARQDAEMGFAIASPVLHLQEGTRKIIFSLKLDFPELDGRSSLSDNVRHVEKSLGSPEFRVGDISWEDLFKQFDDRTEASGPSARIRERLSEDAKDTVRTVTRTNRVSDADRQTMLVALNDLLDRADLLDPKEMAGLPIPQTGRALISRSNLSEEETRRRNRWVLAAAYPDALPAGRITVDAFFRLFSKMFKIQLTTEKGWHDISEVVVMSWITDPTIEEDTLVLRAELPPGVDPIVGYTPETHGPGYETQLPIARFLINPAAYLYPYTLMSRTTFREIRITTDVTGVRDVYTHGNFGPLDSNNPFNPFGPLPSTRTSYLIVGNAEMALKQVNRFSVDVEWADLPISGTGFEDYYVSYELPFHPREFQAKVTALQDGRWMPDLEAAQPTVPLFGVGENLDRISGVHRARWEVGSGLQSLMTPADASETDAAFGYTARTKQGFVKFTLTSPAQAFGHKTYPGILTKTSLENAKPKRWRFSPLPEPPPIPEPNPPYTPLINSVSIDYTASANINLDTLTDDPDAPYRAKLFHIHPFGVECLSSVVDRGMPVLPGYEQDGYLFIGLSGPRIDGPLSLLFHLDDDSRPVERQPAFSWSYLAGNRWEDLEDSAVLSNQTDGFLSSGAITLNLPTNATRSRTMMDRDLYWVRVAIDADPGAVCSVHTIHTNALRVLRHRTDEPGDEESFVKGAPPGSIREARPTIPGVGDIRQIFESFDGKDPEPKADRKTRISERLRHKGRATTAWDYERLILERFPEIFKVKCFANTVFHNRNWDRPGHILIVVIPLAKGGQTNAKPLANSLVLRQIRQFVEELGSPFATVDVRNPVYERVQIRCTVRFEGGIGDGDRIDALNTSLCEYLSPWSDRGLGARFGWRIRRHDVELYIRSLGGVEYVTDFSMLHLADQGAGYHRLFDSVDPEAGHGGREEVHPLFPWSIAIPYSKHYIRTTDTLDAIQPELTGIGELEIGGTFVISGE